MLPDALMGSGVLLLGGKKKKKQVKNTMLAHSDLFLTGFCGCFQSCALPVSWAHSVRENYRAEGIPLPFNFLPTSYCPRPSPAQPAPFLSEPAGSVHSVAPVLTPRPLPLPGPPRESVVPGDTASRQGEPGPLPRAAPVCTPAVAAHPDFPPDPPRHGAAVWPQAVSVPNALGGA